MEHRCADRSVHELSAQFQVPVQLGGVALEHTAQLLVQLLAALGNLLARPAGRVLHQKRFRLFDLFFRDDRLLLLVGCVVAEQVRQLRVTEEDNGNVHALAFVVDGEFVLHQFQLRVEHAELLAGARGVVADVVLFAVVRHQLGARFEVLRSMPKHKPNGVLLGRAEDAVLVGVLLVANQLLLVEDTPLAEWAEGMRVRSIVEFRVLNAVI